MIDFEEKYFKKIEFKPEDLSRYYESAKKDMLIAESFDQEEVVFKFCYDALIKIGIYLIASSGYKVRSMPGHHIKIIEVLGNTLDNQDLLDIFDEMRRKRNKELYTGGIIFSKKDVETYRKVVQEVFELIKNA